MSILFRLLPALVVLFSCKNPDYKKGRIREGDLWVEAEINKDSIVNGLANLYDKSGLLVARYVYINGVRNGLAVNLYPNGNPKDSFRFVNGREDGVFNTYNMEGELMSSTNYFRGLKLGNASVYENQVLKGYNFFDLERGFDVFICDYDSSGKLTSATNFEPHSTISRLIVEGEKKLGFFSYLPRPPFMKADYNLGMIKDKVDTVLLGKIMNKEPFIDTILEYPLLGYHYFLSVHLKDSGDYNKVFFKKFQE